MLKSIFKFSFAALAAMACSGNSEATGSEKSADSVSTPEAEVVEEVPVSDTFKTQNLVVYPFTESIPFTDPELGLIKPKEGEIQQEKVAFEFSVANFTLGEQTPGAGSNGLANSGKGQHIHLIMNNDPYSAHYTSGFEKDLPVGHHIGLAFLSRSFHESVKNPTAFKVFQLAVGNVEAKEPVDLNQPLLFYSRPKGEYKGADTKKILFDFYLVNTNLERDGYTVVATINGEEFEFKKWQPYIIEGLPMGENTINIKLTDGKGNLVETPVNDVTRVFKLVE